MSDWAEEKGEDIAFLHGVGPRVAEAIATALREAYQKGREEANGELREALKAYLDAGFGESTDFADQSKAYRLAYAALYPANG